MANHNQQQTNPVGRLGIIGMRGCEAITDKIDSFLVEWKRDYFPEDDEQPTFKIDAVCPRFGTGEGKGMIRQSIRGYDLYIIADMFNYGVTYEMYGKTVPMSPDDHYQDLKRIISATCGKARRINVIMPMLYEGRQHRRSGRESLDCSLALQELVAMGVDNIITFDAHDARVHNAIPLTGFENFQPVYQMIKALVNGHYTKHLDAEHTMIISPDEGGLSRGIYYSSVLGIDLGMFYKRRDYTVIVKGRNPIVSHEFLGANVEGKDVIVVDDMISSGDSVLDVCKQLKKLGANKIFVFACFGLFCEGLERIDKAYADGVFNKIFTTNLIYQTEELKQRKWYESVEMSKYIAYIISTINCDRSISALVDPVNRIKSFLEKHGIQ